MRIVKLREVSKRLYRFNDFTVSQKCYIYRFGKTRYFVTYALLGDELPGRVKSYIKFSSNNLIDKLITAIILQSININEICYGRDIISANIVEKNMKKHPLFRYLLEIDQVKNMIDSIEVYKDEIGYICIRNESYYALFRNKNKRKNIINKIKVIAKRLGFLNQYEILELLKIL